LFYWPHIHPAVVHFPIALFVTSVGFDLACLVWHRQKWLDQAGVSLHVLAVVGAGAAAITGKLAEGKLNIASLETKALVGEHSDWAFFTLVAFVAVMLIRVEALWRKHSEARRRRLRYLALLVAAGALWLLYQTAGRGASLVYLYGVAVR
jgi:uncharacterized membrane protein